MNKLSGALVGGVTAAFLLSVLLFIMYFFHKPESARPLKISQVGETNGITIYRVEQGVAVGFIGIKKVKFTEGGVCEF